MRHLGIGAREQLATGISEQHAHRRVDQREVVDVLAEDVAVVGLQLAGHIGVGGQKLGRDAQVGDVVIELQGEGGFSLSDARERGPVLRFVKSVRKDERQHHGGHEADRHEGQQLAPNGMHPRSVTGQAAWRNWSPCVWPL